MSTRLDHVVLGVPDLSVGSAELGVAGLRFAAGGRHPAGTRNALLVAAGHWSYVELITAPEEDPADADSQVAERVRRGGLVAWALSVADVDGHVGRLAAEGIECQPVEDGARETTDGRVVRWRSAVIGPGFGQSELPFLIEWAASDAHRTGLAPESEAPYLTDIEVGVRDQERMRILLGVLELPAAPFDGGLECSDGAVLMRFVDAEPRLSAVCLVRPDGRRVRITDREQARRLYARVDAVEGVG